MDSVELAALIVVAFLLAANLALTYGVVRRLREHEHSLAELRSGGDGAGLPPARPRPGEQMPEFAATTASGERIARESLVEGRHFAGFFSPACPPCKERLPEFVRFVSSVESGRSLVVVKGSRDEAESMVADLADDVRIVFDGGDNPLHAALGIDRWPTLLSLSNGVVEVNAAIMGPILTSLEKDAKDWRALSVERS